MSEVVVVSAVRTPFGRLGGALKDFPAPALGTIVTREVLKRAEWEKKPVDYVLMGLTDWPAIGQAPARQVAINSGIPKEVVAIALDTVCTGAMTAIHMGLRLIKNNVAETIIAGGMEGMSWSPYLLPSSRWGYRYRKQEVLDPIEIGLTCPWGKVEMGVYAGEIAKEFGITREEQDRWAYQSQMRYQQAKSEGKFEIEICPVSIKKKKETIVFSEDECPRPDISLEKLSKLPPAFAANGTCTAGNSPPISDGAAALFLMSEEKAKKEGLEILARLKEMAHLGDESRNFPLVPAKAVKKLVSETKIDLSEIDLFEINEAFAVVPVLCARILKINPDKLNVNGGAVAIGHPIGVSGARILMHLIYELNRRGGEKGIGAICGGGSQGEAVLVEVEEKTKI